MSIRQTLIIILLSLTFAITLTEVNLSHIRKTNPANEKRSTQMIKEGGLVYSVDDYWYCNQYKNWREGKGFTIDPAFNHLSTRRTPVYPLIYGFFTYEFGAVAGGMMLKYFQIALFCLSALFMYRIAFYLFKNNSMAFISAVLYATSPFIASFLSFTITEAITPFLVTSSVFLYLKSIHDTKSKWFVLTGIMVAIGILNRPLVLVIAAAIGCAECYFLWTNRENVLARLKKSVLIFFGAVFILSFWVIRNYIVTNGEIIVLERYQKKELMDYGEGLVELRSLVSCFTNPADFNCEQLAETTSNNFVIGESDKNENIINEFVNKFPDDVLVMWNKDTLRLAITGYIDCFRKLYEAKKSITINDILHDSEFLEGNKIQAAKFESMRHRYMRERPVNYFLLTPLKHIKDLVLQSNSASLAFLNAADKKYSTFQLIIKTGFYLLHASFYVLFFISFFVKLIPSWFRLFSAVSFFLLFFILSYMFRYFETRYYLIVLPLVIVNVSFLINVLISRFKPVFQSKTN